MPTIRENKKDEKAVLGRATVANAARARKDWPSSILAFLRFGLCGSRSQPSAKTSRRLRTRRRGRRKRGEARSDRLPLSPAAMASSPANASGSFEEDLEAAETTTLLGDQSSRDNVNDSTRANTHIGGRGNKMKLILACIWNFVKKTFSCLTRLLWLNENLSATVMAFIAGVAVMGTLTLNIYSASYFLAWKRDGSTCHVFPDSQRDDKINGTIQLIVIGLPFICLPLALCIGSLAELAKAELARYLQFVATLVMVEIIYIVFLGAVMTLCMSDVLGKTVAYVTGIIVALFLLCWGCCCRYPTVKRACPLQLV